MEHDPVREELQVNGFARPVTAYRIKAPVGARA
jgi:hypothetical protein